MPRPRRTPVVLEEVDAFLARCRPDIRPLVLRSGKSVPPPTHAVAYDLLSRIDHPMRQAMFVRGSPCHLHSEHWRGKSCGRHPRLHNTYLRRLLFHWFVGPLRPNEELVASDCGCANPFHSVVRPTKDTINPETLRFLNSRAVLGADALAIWANLLGVATKTASWRIQRPLDAQEIGLTRILQTQVADYNTAILPSVPLDYDGKARRDVSHHEHRTACEVCRHGKLCEIALTAERWGVMGSTLGIPLRQLGRIRSNFALVLTAIQRRVDRALAAEHTGRAAGSAEDRPWITRHTKEDAIRLTNDSAHAVLALLVN